MGSVFYTDLEIHRIYDLKGSTHGRAATEKEKRQETPVLKDLDFIENNEIIQIGKTKSKLFCEQLRRDTELLRKLKIMDYSLLLGIHYGNRQETVSPNSPVANEHQLSGAPLNKSDGIATQTQSEDEQLSDKEAADNMAVSSNQHALNDENLKAHNAQIENLDLNPHTTRQQIIDLQIRNPDQMASKTNTGSPSKNIEPPQSTTLQSKSPSLSLRQGTGLSPVPDKAEEEDDEKKVSPTDDIGVLNGAANGTANGTANGAINGGLKPDKIMMARSAPHGPSHVPSAPNLHTIEHESKRPGHIKSLSTSEKPKLGPPGFSRVPSRRISQITSNVYHSRYAVKTPIELNFDMPELVDPRRMNRFEDENDDDQDFEGNIFCQDQGGMQMRYEDGREGDCLYFCGIIDVLQKYNKRKKVENFFRGVEWMTISILCRCHFI